MRKVRKITSVGIFLASGIVSALAADPTGDWRVADGVANIRIAECNGSMWGVVAWEKTREDATAAIRMSQKETGPRSACRSCST